MNLGNKWKDFMGECDKEPSFALLDRFYELGGNFLDTANAYQSEESEEWLGEWMESRGVRYQMVVATKYTTGYVSHRRDKIPLQSNYVGNSIKSLNLSVEASLRKLRTSYIDLMYVHWWDFTTDVEEVMQGLHALVMAGKVLYLGVSDTPAWVVVKANAYARSHGLRPFSVYQGQWNAGAREIEREIVPMCRDQGMAIAPWAPLGQGRLKTAEARSREHSGAARAAQMSEAEIKVSEALEKMARSKDTTLHALALTYLMHKAPYVFPIIGQRSVRHLEANVEALSIRMSREEIHEIDSAVDFDGGFPMNFIFRGSTYHTDLTAADVNLTKAVAHIEAVPHTAPIQHRQREL